MRAFARSFFLGTTGNHKLGGIRLIFRSASLEEIQHQATTSKNYPNTFCYWTIKALYFFNVFFIPCLWFPYLIVHELSHAMAWNYYGFEPSVIILNNLKKGACGWIELKEDTVKEDADQLCSTKVFYMCILAGPLGSVTSVVLLQSIAFLLLDLHALFACSLLTTMFGVNALGNVVPFGLGECEIKNDGALMYENSKVRYLFSVMVLLTMVFYMIVQTYCVALQVWSFNV